MTRLTDRKFLEVVDRTPLVSIDLIVRDPQGRVVLGKRKNEPARGFWFVPGGRILKGESLDEAFGRICAAELGRSMSRADAQLLGVYTHQYDTNFMHAEGITTHYVVLAYVLTGQFSPGALPKEQHDDIRYWNSETALHDAAVHANVHPYLIAVSPSKNPDDGHLAKRPGSTGR